MSRPLVHPWSSPACWPSLWLAGRAEAGKAEEARDYLDRANGAFALNHFVEAADNYEKAFALKPDPAVLYNAAQAHRLAGNKQRALDLYQSYLRMYGTDRRAEIEKHIENLKQAIEKDRAWRRRRRRRPRRWRLDDRPDARPTAPPMPGRAVGRRSSWCPGRRAPAARRPRRPAGAGAGDAGGAAAAAWGRRLAGDEAVVLGGGRGRGRRGRHHRCPAHARRSVGSHGHHRPAAGRKLMRARSIGSPAFVLLAALAAIAAGVRLRRRHPGVQAGDAVRHGHVRRHDPQRRSGVSRCDRRRRRAEDERAQPCRRRVRGHARDRIPERLSGGERVEVRVTALMNGSAIGDGHGHRAGAAGRLRRAGRRARRRHARRRGRHRRWRRGGTGRRRGRSGVGRRRGGGGAAARAGASAGRGGTGGSVGGRGGTGGSVGGRGGTGGSDGWRGGSGGGVVVSNRNFDLLFLIDDSSSMRLAQANLERSFPAFMTRLRTAPLGLPNIHVAVISSDMGAGDGSVAGCDTTGGKQGIFQYTARGTCTATGLQAGSTYISDIARHPELHRQPGERVHLHRRPRRDRLRLRAPVRRRPALARRRRARRRPRRTRASCAPTRTWPSS